MLIFCAALPTAIRLALGLVLKFVECLFRPADCTSSVTSPATDLTVPVSSEVTSATSEHDKVTSPSRSPPDESSSLIKSQIDNGEVICKSADT